MYSSQSICNSHSLLLSIFYLESGSPTQPNPTQPNPTKKPANQPTNQPTNQTTNQPNNQPTSPGRYNLTIQSMIEFHSKMIQFNFWFKRKLLKMIQFNFWFKRKLSKMIQFNFQFKRNCQGGELLRLVPSPVGCAKLK